MDWLKELSETLGSLELEYDKLFFLTDSNVIKLLPKIEGINVIVISAGESSKSLEGLQQVWNSLAAGGATRRSLLVNIGGGVVSDLGGFAAGTYKRGIRHVNVPTTLLAMADAAIGGKTGIDYNGLKNEIGVFKMPERVIIDSMWLDTLPPELMRDGLAEVVKTTMLGSTVLYGRMLELPVNFHAADIADAAEYSARFKEDVVRKDPTEKGLRRILNLGHTAGHAFESLAAASGSPISHGEAVAHGLLVSLILSAELCGLDPDTPVTYADSILKRHYSPLPAGVRNDEKLLEFMSRDKKNPEYGKYSFVLLDEIGKPIESVMLDAGTISDALKRYDELAHK